MGDGGINKLLGEGFKLLAPRDRLGQGVGLLLGNPPREVFPLLPNLVLIVRAPLLVGVLFGGPSLGLEGAVFHAVDLLHLLEELLSFMGERMVHGEIMTSA